MANREACELYIEQQIEEALEDGKTPYLIGKELSSMIERIFETKMPADTLRKRAERIRTNVHNDSTTENDSEKSGNTGNIEPKKIADLVKKEVEKTGSEREAARNIAKKIERPEGSVRVTYQREKAKETSLNYNYELINKMFNDSYAAFRSSILDVKALKWQTTSREAVCEKLEELYSIVNI